ncbi:MAG: hypothetical protein QGH20_01600 [Candidatus Latescibacteria bacterium]|nr:hypothetical protein [Candidatus Latescibacterota bacterium]
MITARGKDHGSERAFFTDPDTGIEYIQLTQAAVHTYALYFEIQSFTYDDRSLIVMSMRDSSRGAPWDVYRVDEDGNNLVQLSDDKHPLNSPAPAHDSRRIFCLRKNSFLSLDIDTFEEVEIARCEEATALSNGTLTRDNKYYLAKATLTKNGDSAVVRFATDGSETEVFFEGVPHGHLDANSSSGKMSFNSIQDGRRAPMVCNIDGTGLKEFGWWKFAHSCWYGNTSKLQGPLLPPDRGIVILDTDDETITPVCSGGPYFWHAGSSWDGEWIISDTNWPDEGLMLVHVPSGRFAPLCESGSANGHPQYNHPHPGFNRAGSKVVYTSNRTGLGQAYIATIPDHIKEDLSVGDLSNRRRRQRP